MSRTNNPNIDNTNADTAIEINVKSTEFKNVDQGGVIGGAVGSRLYLSENGEARLVQKNILFQQAAKLYDFDKAEWTSTGLDLIKDANDRTNLINATKIELQNEIARRKLVHIPLREGRTIHHDVKAKDGTGRIVLRSASKGTGIIAGGPVRAVCEVLGIRDVVAKSLGTANPHNVIRACLKALKKQNPEAMKPLVAAFRASDGDVDTLAKLYKWTEDQGTPWGGIRSPNPKEMNYFAKGLWNYHMNNTLSGKAPINAAIGNLYQITIKPLTIMLCYIPYSLSLIHN